MNYQPPPGQQSYVPQPPGSPPAATGAPVYELSGWWRRVGASIIDSLVVGVITGILAVPLGGWDETSGYNQTGSSASFNANLNGVGFLIFLVVFVLVVPLVMTKTNGRTVGKMATGIRVVREDGQPIEFGFAIIRELVVKYLLFDVIAIVTLGIATLLNYLWPLWDDQHRALHDKLAKSRVVRVDVGPSSAAWAPGQPGAMAQSYPPQPGFGQPGYGQPYPGQPAPPPDPFARPAAPQSPYPGQPAPPAQQPFPTAPPAPPQPPAPPVQQPSAPPQPPAPQPPAPPVQQPSAPPTQAPYAPPQPPMPPQPPTAPPVAPPQAPPGYPQPPANAPVPPAPPANAPIPPSPAPPQPPQQPPAQPGQYQPPPGFENPVPED